MHENDIVLDSDIAMENDRRWDDNEVNTTFEVPIESNYDVPLYQQGV